MIWEREREREREREGNPNHLLLLFLLLFSKPKDVKEAAESLILSFLHTETSHHIISNEEETCFYENWDVWRCFHHTQRRRRRFPNSFKDPNTFKVTSRSSAVNAVKNLIRQTYEAADSPAQVCNICCQQPAHQNTLTHSHTPVSVIGLCLLNKFNRNQL